MVKDGMLGRHSESWDVLPWLGLDREVSAGECSFWPFYKSCDRRIADPTVRNDLRQLLTVFVRPVLGEGKRYATPVPEATIVSLAPHNPKGPGREKAVADARNALAFACLDSNADGNCATTDNFTIYTLRFAPGETAVAYQPGSICKGGHDPLGVEIDELQIQEPGEVVPGYRPRYDPDLLRSLSFAAINQKDNKDCRLLLRSLEYFLQTYKNDRSIQPQVRVVLMAMAFETLLQITSKRDFIKKIDQLCGCNGEPKLMQKIRSLRSAESRVEPLTQKQTWAEDFYFLRDKIVHGQPFENHDLKFDGKSHFSIPVDFFRLCVRKKLEKVSGPNYNCTAYIEPSSHGAFRFRDADSWAN